MTEMIQAFVWEDGRGRIKRTGTLVRCKDCKFWGKEPTFQKDEYKRYCDITNLLVVGEDYCSYGRKRIKSELADR